MFQHYISLLIHNGDLKEMSMILNAYKFKKANVSNASFGGRISEGQERAIKYQTILRKSQTNLISTLFIFIFINGLILSLHFYLSRKVFHSHLI